MVGRSRNPARASDAAARPTRTRIVGWGGCFRRLGELPARFQPFGMRAQRSDRVLIAGLSAHRAQAERRISRY